MGGVVSARSICEECPRGEFAAEKRCGEFAALCDARAAVNWLVSLEVLIHRRMGLPANSPRCEASKFSSDELREFSAAQRLQTPHGFSHSPKFPRSVILAVNTPLNKV